MPPLDPALSTPQVPSASPQQSGPAPAPSAPKIDPRLKQIRTYQGDVEEALKNQHESVFSIREQELARQKLLERQQQPAAFQKNISTGQSGLKEEAGPTIGPKVIPDYTPDVLPNMPHLSVPVAAAREPVPESVPEPLPTPPPVVVPAPIIIPQTLPPYALTPVSQPSRTGKDFKTAGIFLLSLVLLGGAGAAGWFSYHTYKTKTAVPVSIVASNALFPVESTIVLNAASLSRNTLINDIRADKARSLQSGSVEEIELRDGAAADATTTSTGELFNILATHAPSALVRAFDPTFMLGLIGNGSGNPSDTFLIMKIDSFDNVFAGMLDWEQDMPADILPLFLDASSTDAVLNASTTPAFADQIIQNKDTRTLKDASSKTLLIYSFFDQNTVIVADSEANLKTVISLLTAEELVH